MNKIKLPLKYDSNGQFIFDAENKMVLEVRGWGWIQQLTKEQIGCSQSEFQDKLALKIIDILNKDLIGSEFVEGYKK